MPDVSGHDDKAVVPTTACSESFSENTAENDGALESAQIKAEEGVKLRSASFLSHRDEPQNGSVACGAAVSPDNNDSKDDYKEIITLPHSTHSLLFTEPVFSVPFFFAGSIVFISYASLILALLNNLDDATPDNPLNVPVQVPGTVKSAQFMSILIAMLMEEEIPTALYLLRMIPQQSLKEKFPENDMLFGKFVFSAVVRLLLGYIFLFNVFLTAVQAEQVLDIFYDMLALQFVQQLDDIAFHLARMDVLGTHMKRSSTKKCFRVEFERQPFGRFRRMSFFLKTIYLVNFLVFLFGMMYVTFRQNTGYYQANSVTVIFGDEIWEEAVVAKPNGGKEKMVLAYSYFNGVYEHNGLMHDGRPVYTEMSKFDNTPYDEKIGAEIKYCKSEGAWVFTHKNIRKSDKPNDWKITECPWLLKSPETKEYDLLHVSGEWSIWVGVIMNGAAISIVDNICSDSKGEASPECNLNGVCTEGKCHCDKRSGHFGTHCQHKEPCNTIRGIHNDTWSIIPWQNEASFLTEYQRPVYLYRGGYDFVNRTRSLPKPHEMALLFSGSRWFAMHNKQWSRMDGNAINAAQNYHSFWDKAYIPQLTYFVSDPSAESTPIGIDFYLIGEREYYNGPFGVLYPIQEPPGRGYFHCYDDIDTSTNDTINGRELSFDFMIG